MHTEASALVAPSDEVLKLDPSIKYSLSLLHRAMRDAYVLSTHTQTQYTLTHSSHAVTQWKWPGQPDLWTCDHFLERQPDYTTSLVAAVNLGV